MDSSQEWGGLYLNLKQADSFLSKHRNRYEKNKKFIELRIAWLFARVLSNHNKEEYLIGFPALWDLVKDRRLTIREAIDQKIILDEDFDIVIAPKEKVYRMNHKLQIVRFTGEVERNTQGIIDFLKEKKFNIPKDENLLLLVWLEKGLKLNQNRLSEKLNQTNVPYGQVFMIGETKRSESAILFCVEVFPQIKRMYLNLGFRKKQKPT